MGKLPLSVALISYNEEANLRRTLEAVVDIAEEIVLLDSFSTDKTCEIAEEYSAKIFQDHWKGHIDQKNEVFSKCSSDWILSLDCDEVITENLRNEIIQTLSEPIYKGYFINRKTVYLGKELNFAWQPDYKLRLVKRDANPIWRGMNPHDELVIDGKTTKLNHPLLHYTYKDIEHQFQVSSFYAKISAQSYASKGIKFSILKFFINPFAAFIKSYFIKQSYRDGMVGFLAAFGNFYKTILKYVYLWEIENNSKR